MGTEEGTGDNRQIGKIPIMSGKNLTKVRSRDSKLGVPSIQVNHRTQFFEDYRKEAEEYDKEFMKKYDEDLNTTLIFVSSVLNSGA